MMTIAKVPVLTPEGNLNSYLQQIRKFPMLTQNEEFMLAKAWREKGKVDSSWKINSIFLYVRSE